MKGALRIDNKHLDIVKDSRYFGILCRKRDRSIPDSKQWLTHKLQPIWHDLTPLNIMRITTRLWVGYFMMDKRMGDFAVMQDYDFNKLEQKLLEKSDK